MFRFFKIYSIDVALGAVVCTWFLAAVIQINLSWYIYFALGLSVWSIYTADHLLDGLKLKGRGGPERYLQHLKNFKPIVFLVVIAVCGTVAIAIIYIQKELLEYGFLLAGITFIYFLLRLFLKVLFSGLKELLAAFIYTAGVALPSYYFMEDFSFFYMLVVLQLFCIVFANLLICSIWDENWDRANAYDSMVVLFGKKFINSILFILIAIAVVSASAGFFIYEGHYITVQLIILLMGLALILIYYYGERWDESYQRLLIDSIFFLPLLLFIL